MQNKRPSRLNSRKDAIEKNVLRSNNELETRCVKKTATMIRGNNCSKTLSNGRIRPLAPSSSLFRENPLAGWKVTISTNRRIGIPLLLHAREGVSYLRPSLNSPSVKSDQQSPPLASSFSLSSSLYLSFASQAPSFFPSLPLFFSRSLIFTENPERHYPCREDSGRSSKIAFRGSASTERKWSLRQWNKKFFDIVDNVLRKNIR